MIGITVKYGLNRSVQTEVEQGLTVGELVADDAIRTTLGLPESVGAQINGVTVEMDTTLRSGDVVTLERRAAQKA